MLSQKTFETLRKSDFIQGTHAFGEKRAAMELFKRKRRGSLYLKESQMHLEEKPKETKGEIEPAPFDSRSEVIR